MRMGLLGTVMASIIGGSMLLSRRQSPEYSQALIDIENNTTNNENLIEIYKSILERNVTIDQARDYNIDIKSVKNNMLLVSEQVKEELKW